MYWVAAYCVNNIHAQCGRRDGLYPFWFRSCRKISILFTCMFCPVHCPSLSTLHKWSTQELICVLGQLTDNSMVTISDCFIILHFPHTILCYISAISPLCAWPLNHSHSLSPHFLCVHNRMDTFTHGLMLSCQNDKGNNNNIKKRPGNWGKTCFTLRGTLI